MTETNLQHYDVTSRADAATTKADLNTENLFTSHRRAADWHKRHDGRQIVLPGNFRVDWRLS